jgi:hypothetical protein
MASIDGIISSRRPHPLAHGFKTRVTLGPNLLSIPAAVQAIEQKT